MAFIILSASFVGYGTIVALFSFDFLPIALIYHPTVFAGVVSAGVSVAAFSDILRHSIMQRDKAILQRRYQFVTNRSLAYLTEESDILGILQWIGESYESSLAIGDKRLLRVSTTMRRRLMALRKESIPLTEELAIESDITDIKSLANHSETTLVLDYEDGKFEVPPLIFEGVIAEISTQLSQNETIVVSEYRRAVRFHYPARIHLSDSAISSISERCSLIGQAIHLRPGAIIIFREDQVQ